MAVGFALFAAGVLVALVAESLVGVPTLTVGIAIASRGERAFARAERLLAPRRTGYIDGCGPGPNSDAMAAGINHSHF